MFLLTKPKGANSRGSLHDGLIASYLFDDGVGDILHDSLGWAVRPSNDLDRWVVTGSHSNFWDGTYQFLGNIVNGERVYAYVGGGTHMYFNGTAWCIGGDPFSTPHNEIYTGGVSLPGTWAAVNAGNEPAPTVAQNTNNVVSAPLDGTLINFSPTYNITVNGGAFTDETFTPRGTEYGQTKYLSADGNTKVSYFYEMDPSMDGAWYLWASTASHPWMDGYETSSNVVGPAWTGSWTGGYTVTQGDAQPGPWFSDGLDFNNSNYVSIPNTGSVFDFGLGDFTICARLKAGASLGQAAQLLSFDNSDPTKWIGVGIDSLQPWGGSSNWAISVGGAAGRTVYPFPSSTAVYTANTSNAIVITADRDGYAKLFLNGSYVSQVDISAVSALNFGSMGNLEIGVHSELIGNSGWCWDGFIGRLEIFNRALTDDEATAWTGNSDRVAVMPRLPLFAFMPGDTPATATGAYYYRYLTSLWTEAQ